MPDFIMRYTSTWDRKITADNLEAAAARAKATVNHITDAKLVGVWPADAPRPAELL